MTNGDDWPRALRATIAPGDVEFPERVKHYRLDGQMSLEHSAIKTRNHSHYFVLMLYNKIVTRIRTLEATKTGLLPFVLSPNDEGEIRVLAEEVKIME